MAFGFAVLSIGLAFAANGAHSRKWLAPRDAEEQHAGLAQAESPTPSTTVPHKTSSGMYTLMYAAPSQDVASDIEDYNNDTDIYGNYTDEWGAPSALYDNDTDEWGAPSAQYGNETELTDDAPPTKAPRIRRKDKVDHTYDWIDEPETDDDEIFVDILYDGGANPKDMDFFDQCYPGQGHNGGLLKLRVGFLADPGFLHSVGGNGGHGIREVRRIVRHVNAIFEAQFNINIEAEEFLLATEGSDLSSKGHERLDSSVPDSDGICSDGLDGLQRLAQTQRWAQDHRPNSMGAWALLTDCALKNNGTAYPALAYPGKVCSPMRAHIISARHEYDMDRAHVYAHSFGRLLGSLHSSKPSDENSTDVLEFTSDDYENICRVVGRSRRCISGEALCANLQQLADAECWHHDQCPESCYDNGRMGNGVCDQQCNTEACNFDNGDCSCAVGCVNRWRGDGICDAACNTAGCNYDNGDCVCYDGCSASSGFDCQWLASFGECDNNPDYMNTCCQKTCGTCEKPTDGQHNKAQEAPNQAFLEPPSRITRSTEHVLRTSYVFIRLANPSTP